MADCCRKQVDNFRRWNVAFVADCCRKQVDNFRRWNVAFVYESGRR
jgi:hypothetical protein